MSVVGRGTKNAFRNSIRTVSIVAILALSIGLAVVMLLSMKAVDAKTADVKSSVGNTISITPAGARGFQGGGTPLSDADVAKIEKQAHVVSATPSIQDRLSTEGATSGAGPFMNANANAVTNLTSPITPGVIGEQNNGGQGGQGGVVARGLPEGFSLPITVTGTTDPTSAQVSDVSSFAITSGSTIDGTSSENVALVGKDLATKNNLTVGSTFTAYGQTITVKGIYDTGNTFTNAGVIMPLASLQALSGQTGVTSVIARVDSVENLDATVASLQAKLDDADVVSDATGTADTVASLDNIRTIALYSLIGALVAAAVIILLSMVMIVRERRREIGVLKAIGSSNAKISFQFATEALTLTLMAAVAGILVGIVLSNPVLDVLVSSESTQSAANTVGIPPGANGGVVINGGPPANPGNGPNAQGGPPRINIGDVGQGFTDFGDSLSNVSTTVGFDVLLYGLLAAVLVAILGSAFPSWLIARVRPAEVMRAE